MGVVYRATHLRLERTVALKLIAPALAQDPAFVSRFEREWRLMAALEHPNVIGIYEAGEVDGRLYLAMRWVAGGDLAARLRGTAGLDPRVAIELLGQVAAALDAAHQRGVVHRDIKPANVLLDGEHAWLTDFGAGKDLAGGDTRTAPGRWVGTVDYVAPELLDGADPTPAADVYSLGCVLFEALTGRVPFPRDTEVATLWAHRFEPPPSTTDARPGLPRALDDVLRRMLAKEPGGAAGERGRGVARRPRGGHRPAGGRRDRGRAAPADAGAHGASRRRAGDTPPARPPPRAPRRRRGRRSPAPAWPRGLLLGGDDAPTPTPRERAPAPFVDRIALGEGASAGRRGRQPDVRLRHRRAEPRSHPGAVELTQGAATDQAALAAARSRADQRRTAPLGHARGPPARGHRPRARASGPTSGSTSKAATSRSPARTSSVLSPDGDGRLQRVDPQTHRTVGEPYPLGGSPTDLDALGDRVVETTALPPQLHRFAPELGRPQTIDIETDGVPAELLRAAAPKAGSPIRSTTEVVRFDATTGKALSKVKVAQQAGRDRRSTATTSGSPRAAGSSSASTPRPRSGWSRSTPRARSSGDIAVSGGVAWAPGADDLVRIEPRED